MKVLVCGGRNYDDYNHVVKILDWLPITLIIHGGATGADALAGKYAYEKTLSWVSYCADWDRHGRRAGYIRNLQMLDEGKPDLVVAFPGGKGTTMMIKLAKEAAVPVLMA
jgi:hypothetical protein